MLQLVFITFLVIAAVVGLGAAFKFLGLFTLASVIGFLVLVTVGALLVLYIVSQNGPNNPP